VIVVLVEPPFSRRETLVHKAPIKKAATTKRTTRIGVVFFPRFKLGRFTWAM